MEVMCVAVEAVLTAAADGGGGPTRDGAPSLVASGVDYDRRSCNAQKKNKKMTYATFFYL